MKKKWKQCLAVILTFAMCFVQMSIFALAEGEIETVEIDVTYGQTEAREMLSLINEFRTGEDAWFWNEENTEKVYQTGLSELIYDYELEQAAMQRAAELALFYDHMRPDGSSCFTAYSWVQAAENIAAGYQTAEAVFEGWQETEEAYAGQGHRRNMLSSGVTAIGIGHVVYNGIHYWVQEFRSPASEMEQTEANDTTTTVSVDIKLSNVTKTSIDIEPDSLTVTSGQSVNLPEILTSIQMTETWPRTSDCMVKANYSWTVEDNQYASISGNQLTGIQAGTTSLQAIVLGQTVSIPVTVKASHVHNYGNPRFEWTEDYSSATAIFTCEAGDDTQTVTGNVSKEIIGATCTEDGSIIYTVTVEFNGNTYMDSRKTAGEPATGHRFVYTDKGDGTHQITCASCDYWGSEEHTYENGVCIYCGAEEPEEPTTEEVTTEEPTTEEVTTEEPTTEEVTTEEPTTEEVTTEEPTTEEPTAEEPTTEEVTTEEPTTEEPTAEEPTTEEVTTEEPTTEEVTTEEPTTEEVTTEEPTTEEVTTEEPTTEEPTAEEPTTEKPTTEEPTTEETTVAPTSTQPEETTASESTSASQAPNQTGDIILGIEDYSVWMGLILLIGGASMLVMAAILFARRKN